MSQPLTESIRSNVCINAQLHNMCIYGLLFYCFLFQPKILLHVTRSLQAGLGDETVYLYGHVHNTYICTYVHTFVGPT